VVTWTPIKRVCNDASADKMLQRIAADENLQMIFYVR